MSVEGWKNYETWSVANAFQKDEALYKMITIEGYRRYSELAAVLLDLGITKTLEGVRYDDPIIDVRALSELLRDMNEGS